MEENIKFAKNKIISANAAELCNILRVVLRREVIMILSFVRSSYLFRKGVPIFITY